MAHLCQRRAGGDKRPLRLETFDQFSAEEDYNHHDLVMLEKGQFSVDEDPVELDYDDNVGTGGDDNNDGSKRP